MDLAMGRGSRKRQHWLGDTAPPQRLCPTSRECASWGGKVSSLLHFDLTEPVSPVHKLLLIR